MDWFFDRIINLDSETQIRYLDTKHQLADILTKDNFTRDEWHNLLHLLFTALRIPAWWAAPKRWRKGCRNKREKKEVWQHRKLQRWTCLLMFPARSSSAKSPIASKGPEILIAPGKTWKQDEKKFEIRRSVEFSSATARCILWRVDGHFKRGIRGCGRFRVCNFQSWGDPSLVKRLRGNPMHGSNQTNRRVQKLKEKNGHTIYTCLQPQFTVRKQYSRSSGGSNQTNRRVQKLKEKNGHTSYRCLQPQFTVRKQYSRSSGGSTDENMTTLLMIGTWIGIFGVYYWMPLFERQYEANLRYVKNHLGNGVGQLFYETRKLISEQKEVTGVSTIRFKDLSWMSTSLLCSKGYQITNAKAYVFSDSVLCWGTMEDDPIATWNG